MTLAIHLLGRGFGESIVVELPGGKVGVIDCFSTRLGATGREDRLRANPTLRFLVNHLGAKSLAFVAFTHPHEDHGRGLSQLLTEYEDHIEQIWIFKGYQSIHLERFYHALLKSGRRLSAQVLLEEPPNRFAIELLHIRNQVIKQCALANPHGATIREFSGEKTVQVEDEPVTFRFLGPCENLAAEYEASLQENLQGFVTEDATVVNGDWQPDKVNHNLASPALLLEYGRTRILLGGDMESGAWRQALKAMTPKEEELVVPCQLVKVSHHGSTTGLPEELCRALQASGKVVAALTPFNRHQSPLPSCEGVARWRPYATELLTTNTAGARRAFLRTALKTPASFPGEIRSLVPPPWASQPNLLHPSLTDGSKVSVAADGFPEGLIEALLEQPWLVELLHPDLREEVSWAAAEPADVDETCRLSFHFNDQGQELRDLRYVGLSAGLFDFQPSSVSMADII